MTHALGLTLVLVVGWIVWTVARGARAAERARELQESLDGLHETRRAERAAVADPDVRRRVLEQSRPQVRR